MTFSLSLEEKHMTGAHAFKTDLGEGKILQKTPFFANISFISNI